jgi:chromosome segregation ATPase
MANNSLRNQKNNLTHRTKTKRKQTKRKQTKTKQTKTKKYKYGGGLFTRKQKPKSYKTYQDKVSEFKKALYIVDKAKDNAVETYDTRLKSITNYNNKIKPKNSSDLYNLRSKQYINKLSKSSDNYKEKIQKLTNKRNELQNALTKLHKQYKSYDGWSLI